MAKTKFNIEIYKDGAGEFRAKIISRNGRITWDSGEGYKQKAALLRSIASLQDAVLNKKILIVDTTEG